MTTIDEYLQGTTPAQQAEYRRIQTIVKQLAPDAEESVSYGIPTFKYHKRPLVYFGAFADHMSIYPASDNMIEAIPELAAFRTSTGTLQYTEAKPISDELVKAFVNFRLQDIQS